MSIICKIKKWLFNQTHPVIGEVLMLHRIVNKKSFLEDNRLMEVTPAFLEKTIQEYKRLKYRMISLDELYEIIQTGKRPKQKFVCFTLDDGYIDNYALAYPLFKKYNCPFAIYISTDFPDGKALLWWYLLDFILLNNEKIILGDGSEYICDTIEMKNNTFKAIREKIFGLRGVEQQQIIDLFKDYNNLFDDILKENSMTWEHILKLSHDSNCTIASHSVSHLALNNLSYDQLYSELKMSKEIIESRINKSVYHFAYPFGRSNDVVSELISHFEYRTAVNANGGVIRSKVNQYSIPRISLIENDFK